MSLRNLSAMLSDMNFRQEALQVIGEGVDMFKQLAKENPNAFSSDLAICLNNRSTMLSQLGFKTRIIAGQQGGCGHAKAAC